MRFLIVFALVLVAFSFSAVAKQHNTAPAVSEWYFKYGVNEPVMQAGDTFLWGPGQEIHYFLKPYRTPLNTAQTITITYRVEAVSGSPVAKSTECTAGQIAGGNDGALAALMIRNTTDNTKPYGRAWYIPRQPVTIGTRTISAPLSSPEWTFVNAGTGPVQNPDKWRSLLSNPRDIALTFNGCSSMGHGAYVDGGTMRFTIVSVTVN